MLSFITHNFIVSYMYYTLYMYNMIIHVPYDYTCTILEHLCYLLEALPWAISEHFSRIELPAWNLLRSQRYLERVTSHL